jgi:hypothetical protein
MADSTNQWQVETQNNASRAMAALAIAIPITLSGKDANGVEFTEKTRTIVIDRRGGKIATKCDLSPGSELTLYNPIVGQTGRIRVVSVGEKRAGEEPCEVGVQLLGSENIWGIDFPSPDRQENGLQAPPLKVHSSRTAPEAASSPGPSAAPRFAVPDAGPSPRRANTSRPAPSLAAARVRIPQPSPSPVAVATLAPPVEESDAAIEATQTRLITQRKETAGEKEARFFPERAGESSRSSSLPRQSNPPFAAKNLERGKSSVDERVKRLEGGLHACCTKMQQVGAEVEELKHAVQNEMGKALRQVQESRPKVVELAISDLEKKVREEIDSLAEELIDLTQKRVQEQVAAALEPLIQGALERVYSVADEQSARAGEGNQALLSRLNQEGQTQLDHMLQSATSEFQKELHQISGTTLAAAQAEITQARSKSAAGFEAQLQETAGEVEESAAKQMQKQAEDALILLGEELKTCGKNVKAEMEERLSGASRSALDSVSSAADFALQEFQLRLAKHAETSVDNCTRRLEESLMNGEGEQGRSALSHYRKALEQEIAEPLARMKTDLAQALQDVSEKAARQASALNDLRKAVEEESLQTLANVKTAATQAIGEVSGQIERQVNASKELCGEVLEESARTLAQAKSEATQAIREVSEQAGRDVEALNNLRNSLVEEAAQALPRFQQDLEQVMGEVANQVQQQVNMLCSLVNLIEKESAQVFSQVKNDLAQALAESSLVAEQQMKSTRAAFSDWETRMGSRLESQLQQLEGKTRASLETLQKQSEEFLKSTGEKLRRESQALPEQIEASLKEAAGNIEQNWLARIRGIQRQAADEILEASITQLGKQLQDNLDLFSEELKLKQEQATSGIAEAFRNKIVEVLSVLQSPPGNAPPPEQVPSPDTPNV